MDPKRIVNKGKQLVRGVSNSINRRKLWFSMKNLTQISINPVQIKEKCIKTIIKSTKEK